MPGIIPPGDPSAFPQGHSQALVNLLHFFVNGGSNGQPGLGFGEVPSQLAQMFNPTTKAGAAQILGMLAGGGGADSVLNREMPGQFENYSLPKAQASGHVTFNEGMPYQVRQALSSMKSNQHLLTEPGYGLSSFPRQIATGKVTQAQQLLHDILFGGESHTRGSIPRKP